MPRGGRGSSARATADRHGEVPDHVGAADGRLTAPSVSSGTGKSELLTENPNDPGT
ncbi:hypothetical protein FMEAI12_5270026 [Parafrankia sp. Ea1.12]|nr:hypothetical protein FMEAI12_5270026 [Parafrankia sp. Ea1.12]